MEQCAREYLARVLSMTGGNVTRAAKIAGRNRTEMYRLLHRYGVELRREGTSGRAKPAKDGVRPTS